MANLGSSLVKGNPIISSGPFSLVTLMIASQIPVFLANHFSSDQLELPPTDLILSLVFLSIFMAGLFQAVFGQFCLGQLGPVNIHANQMMVHTKLSLDMKLRSSFS